MTDHEIDDSDDPTTEELIRILGEDVKLCHELIIDDIDDGTKLEDGTIEANYEFHARQLVRAVFAFIEAVMFSVKVGAIARMEQQGIDHTWAERMLAVEVDHDLTDTGEVRERRTKLRLSDNLRFMFSLLERNDNSPGHFDPSVEWWSFFKKSIKVRDRLMHPRMPGDVDLNPNELLDALNAYYGFTETLMKYSQHSSNVNAT